MWLGFLLEKIQCDCSPYLSVIIMTCFIGNILPTQLNFVSWISRLHASNLQVFANPELAVLDWRVSPSTETANCSIPVLGWSVMGRLWPPGLVCCLSRTVGWPLCETGCLILVRFENVCNFNSLYSFYKLYGFSVNYSELCELKL